jgi:orotate phosphoribosyltransferase
MDVMQELNAANAVLLDRHFVYKSGKHGSGYINMDPIFPDVFVVKQLCEMLAEPFHRELVEVVAAPAVGGIILAAFTALELDDSVSGPLNKVEAVWADKDQDEFVFERASFADLLEDVKVLVVEDLLTTGGSVKKVCQQIERHGGHVVGVSVICNRGGVTAEQLGVPRLEALASVNFEAVNEADCDLCRSLIPIVEDIGHGKEYKAQHPDYAGGYVTLIS